MFASCGTNKSKDNFEYSNLALVDSLEIILPLSYNLNTTAWTTYKANNQTRLVEYEMGIGGDLVIHQIDFDKGAYLDPVVIYKDGPNGYNAPAASVFFKTADSIYIFPAAKYEFYLFNSKGKKIDTYQYRSDYEKYYRGGFYSNAVPFKNQLAITTNNDTRWDAPEFFSKVLPVQLYDYDSSKLIEHIKYPEYTRDWQGWKIQKPGASINKIDEESLLINYSFSDSVYIYNVISKKIESIYCGSDFFGKHRPYKKKPEQMDQILYLAKEIMYENAFFHQGKIFRLVSHLKDQSFYDYPAMDIFEQNLRSQSLIALDLKTQKLKFYKMPLAKYFVFDKNHLYVGSISSREDSLQTTYDKFYKYELN